THGNACGLGMAEVTNRRTIAEVDQSATAINALTGGHPSAAGMPIAFETDRDCIEAIIPTIGLTDPENARVVHITNTMLVGETLVSEAFAEAIAARDDLEVLTNTEPMQFDDEDNLIPVAAAGAAVHA
ncbi:MAG: [Fe-S]-binding protein, partial [Planctomycetota bacterium]|nr:[Fe-S]-binding protein [Planctomycetota bacterium]